MNKKKEKKKPDWTEIDRCKLKCYSDVVQQENPNNTYYVLAFRYYI